MRDNALILRTEGVQEMGMGDAVWELPAPLPSFMCPTPLGVNVRDEVVRFTVVLLAIDADTVIAEAAAEATPRCPEDEQREFCERICSG
jgi:hypothetical protein